MLANFPGTRGQRRGVVLVLILGMLGLLALVGVTFATFSGQARIHARNFAQAQNWPDSSEMMDFALAQLIDDTDSPQSAIRGHSLKRDMYGNDALYNAALAGHPADGSALVIPSVTLCGPAKVPVVEIDGSIPSQQVDVTGLYKCVTNI